MKQKLTCLHRCFLLFMIFILSSIALLAQQASTVTGVVKDEAGNPLSGVSINAHNITTNKSYETMSDTLGNFKFDKIDPNGTYRFNFTSVGYKPY